MVDRKRPAGYRPDWVNSAEGIYQERAEDLILRGKFFQVDEVVAGYVKRRICAKVSGPSVKVVFYRGKIFWRHIRLDVIPNDLVFSVVDQRYLAAAVATFLYADAGYLSHPRIRRSVNLPDQSNFG